MYKLAFIHFFFLYEPKTRTISLEIDGLVTKNIFVFSIANHALFQSYAEFNKLL